jgi:membrane protein implicated in regulation of membrane protease activity
MSTNRWLAVWGALALCIAVGITTSAVTLFPGQKEYGFLLIAIVLGVVGLLGARFINRQPDPLQQGDGKAQ